MSGVLKRGEKGREGRLDCCSGEGEEEVGEGDDEEEDGAESMDDGVELRSQLAPLGLGVVMSSWGRFDRPRA